jgi:NADH-quinone oxidoreductase subunit N
MLAYSSIAHAGYLLIGVVSLHANASAAVFYYAMAYAIASLMSFGILYVLAGNAEDAGFDAFNGLAKRSPLLALGMTIAMLSLAGIPPTAGFFAKYYLFSTAMEQGYYTLVIVAIIASLISMYYYFRVIIAMYASPADSSEELTIKAMSKAVIVASMLLLIVLSVIPEIFLRWLF